MKLAGCKSALNPPVVCSTDRSKAVVPVLVFIFVALWSMYWCEILNFKFSLELNWKLHIMDMSESV